MEDHSSRLSANRDRFPRSVTWMLFAGLLLVLSAADARADLHVSPDGNDGNPGTQAQPLRTLLGARDRLRTMDAKETDDVSVLLKAGDYFISDTVRLEEQESGATGHPVIYRNWDEKGSASLIGGRALTEWLSRVISKDVRFTEI